LRHFNEGVLSVRSRLLNCVFLAALVFEVFKFVGEGGQRDAWAIWASEYLLNEGDRLLADGSHLSASLYYASAWDYLLHHPPCC
jgi:hypothetical protein